MLREGEREGPGNVLGYDPKLQYPENLTVSNLTYYICAPTLVYQVGRASLHG